MYHLDHPNVQNLIGVCLDVEVPYLIMPFMERGSLLMYLRKERGHLLMYEDSEDNQVNILQSILLSIPMHGLIIVTLLYYRFLVLEGDYLTCAIRLRKEWSTLLD